MIETKMICKRNYKECIGQSVCPIGSKYAGQCPYMLKTITFTGPLRRREFSLHFKP